MVLLRRIIFIAALAAITGSLVSCQKNSPAKEVVLYCSVDQAVAEPIIARFEKETGIKVLARFDTEASKTVGLVQKIRAEKSNPAADVFWSSEIFYTIRLGHEELFEPFESETVVNWPKTFMDQNRRWYAFGLRGRVIAYNTNKVTEAQAPSSLEDCLEHEWKNRVVMARPQFGTTGGDVASWFALYGKEEAEKILQRLKNNGIRIVSGNSTAVRMVSTGQADICFTDTDDVYAGKRNGWPIGMKMLRRAGKGTLTIPNTAAIVRGAPHPENAGRLMDFLLGGEAEIMLLQSDSHNWPVMPGTHSDNDAYNEYRIPDPLEIDYKLVADNLEYALRKTGEILD
ncbi:MAG: extracellular solute-binding protein [Planctomycetota bacterium]